MKIWLYVGVVFVLVVFLVVVFVVGYGGNGVLLGWGGARP